MYSFFFTEPATTAIYTLSLHDALPIYDGERWRPGAVHRITGRASTENRDRERGGSRLGSSRPPRGRPARDRKSTRLNSSHGYISYAVFCLKKKKKKKKRSIASE